jgi:hypothetical protein
MPSLKIDRMLDIGASPKVLMKRIYNLPLKYKMSHSDFYERQAFLGNVVGCNAAERKCWDRDYIWFMHRISGGYGYVAMQSLGFWQSLKDKHDADGLWPCFASRGDQTFVAFFDHVPQQIWEFGDSDADHTIVGFHGTPTSGWDETPRLSPKYTVDSWSGDGTVKELPSLEKEEERPAKRARTDSVTEGAQPL